MTPALDGDIHRLISAVASESDDTATLLHLTANESPLSDSARLMLSLPLADRYFMGSGDFEGIVDFNPFMFRGLPATGALVERAEAAASAMLSAELVTLRCLSGLHAMLCTILSATEPGDTILSLAPAHGGHFATQSAIERSGRLHASIPFDLSSLSVNVSALVRKFHSLRARAVYLDTAFALGPHDIFSMREGLGDEALIIFDASHSMGLIMGEQFQRPLAEGADILCGNTHKTLPGPQKGLVAFRDRSMAQRVMPVISGTLTSSGHTGSTLALAVTILEHATFGRAFAAHIVANANALGAALCALGFEVRRHGATFTRNHQVHLMAPPDLPRRELFQRLLHSGISANFDACLGGDGFVRLGTQDVTRKGMGSGEMDRIASLISRALEGESVRSDIEKLVHSFPDIHYSFDTRAPRESLPDGE